MSGRPNLQRLQRPYLVAEVVLAALGVLVMTFGASGQVNWIGTALLMLVPVIDSRRSIVVYRHEDEYAQKLTLMSAAFGFAVVMASMLVMSLLIVTQSSVDFAAGTLVGVYIAGYAVFIATQFVLARRDAKE